MAVSKMFMEEEGRKELFALRAWGHLSEGMFLPCCPDQWVDQWADQCQDVWAEIGVFSLDKHKGVRPQHGLSLGPGKEEGADTRHHVEGP